MTKSKSEKAEVEEKAEVQVETDSSSSDFADKSREIANFVSGIPHTVVTFFNPEWDKGTEEDCWYVVLPLEDLTVVVRTPYSGYTPSGKLRDLAMSMMAKPSGVEENAICEYPEISNPSDVKVIAFPVPIYLMS